MKIAVLGTGSVGPALAAAFARLGHDVAIGTRDPQATLARTEPGATGGPPFTQWHAAHQEIAVRTFADAAAASELVVNATNGAASLAALAEAGAENLAGKIVVDVSNALDFSQGFPPSLNPVNTDSIGEQIQRAFPEARVVKTLNTMANSVMVDPRHVAGGDHTVFVSGNDAGAKAAVTDILTALGHTDVLDLGDITTARGVEMILPLWLRIWGALGTADFNVKVAR
ncbi:MAG: oxidoreductase [Pseudarthrobacter sp.]|nr:oxidoreductase [Pseudarthrobacter sp.]